MDQKQLKSRTTIPTKGDLGTEKNEGDDMDFNLEFDDYMDIDIEKELEDIYVSTAKDSTAKEKSEEEIEKELEDYYAKHPMRRISNSWRLGRVMAVYWFDIHSVPLANIIAHYIDYQDNYPQKVYRMLEKDYRPCAIFGARDINMARDELELVYLADNPIIRGPRLYEYEDFECDFESKKIEDIKRRVVEWEIPFDLEEWEEYIEFEPICYVRRSHEREEIQWPEKPVQEKYTQQKLRKERAPGRAAVFSWSDSDNVPFNEIMDHMFSCKEFSRQWPIYRFDDGNPQTEHAVLCAENKQEAIDTILQYLPHTRKIPREKMGKLVTIWEEQKLRQQCTLLGIPGNYYHPSIE